MNYIMRKNRNKSKAFTVQRTKIRIIVHIQTAYFSAFSYVIDVVDKLDGYVGPCCRYDRYASFSCIFVQLCYDKR